MHLCSLSFFCADLFFKLGGRCSIDFGGIDALQLDVLVADDNELTRVPKSVASQTTVRQLNFGRNRIKRISPSMFAAWTRLQHLYLHQNRLAELPASLGQLTALVSLNLANNALTDLPEQLGELKALRALQVSENRLTRLTPAITRCTALTSLALACNRLTFLPQPLPQLNFCNLWANPTPLPFRDGNCVALLDSHLFALTATLAMILDSSLSVCIGLQDLELPALVTLEIIDAAFPNAIPMHKKWNLITAVKHFH